MSGVSFINAEIKKIDYFDKFEKYIDSVNHFHVQNCNNKGCDNCQFVANVTILWVGSLGGRDRLKHLQHFCVKFFNSYFSLQTMINFVAVNEDKRKKFEEKIK